MMGKEGYQLDVELDRIFITANSDAGIFYAVQTLLQSLPVEIFSRKSVTGIDWKIPCSLINDKPRFSWRGMHLDVGRHFFPKEFVKKYIDLLALYKMNTFHWHLTEDQGWRIEIKKYPKLTEVGGWRKQTMGDNTPYGGFYTQEEVKEIVEYARQRFITIVPEIEMPGHSLAALAAYPELSCTNGKFEVGTEWGVFDDVFCGGNEKTFEFIKDVFDEVCALFPGQYVHIGGDECPKSRWDVCPKCKARIKVEGLKDSHELRSYFIKRVEKLLADKKKRLIGWDEILEGGLAPNATVMSWRGVDGGIAAAKSGHDVIMTPTSNCYFDYSQSVKGEPSTVGGYLPLDVVYSYDPIPAELSSEEAKHVLGSQGNVWTEWMPTTDQVEYMVLPRLCAMSEVGWTSPAQKNYNEFVYRLESHYDMFSLLGYNYRVPTPLGIGGRYIVFGDSLITVESPVSSATIYYTLDGSSPSSQSLKYESPLLIKGGDEVKCVLVLPNGKTSGVVSTQFTKVDPKTNGVEYAYYEGGWDNLPDFTILQPEAIGKVYDLSLDDIPHRPDNFSVILTTNIVIDKKGEYVFYLNSDDGSKLFVDNKIVIDNDGLHGPKEINGIVVLVKGKHKLKVEMFERTGNESLSVALEGGRNPKHILLPKSLLLK